MQVQQRLSKFCLRQFSTSQSSQSRGPALSVDTMNPNLLKAQYAVRGPLLALANQLDAQLKRGDSQLPFDEIIFCNIGNPQSLKQKPISFYREVLSLLESPHLIDSMHSVVKPDVIERAKRYFAANPHGTGAYSHSKGDPLIRQDIADFLVARDGYEADPELIYLTNGASSGVATILSLLIRSNKDGVLLPIPQYPLYSATLDMLGAQQLRYYLDENKGWGLNVEDLRNEFDAALKKGINPRGLVIINPGNPTGQCLDHENMVEIVKFCDERNILLLADEVYQENVYVKETKPFISFKKVACELRQNKNLSDAFQMVSFHSTSKGYIGECGKRGGYMEVFGVPEDALAQIYKLASISLCPNLSGQYTTGLMVNPPKPGEPSHDQFVQERDDIYNSLKSRALKLVSALNKLEGVSCNQAEGAMYAFPKLEFPQGVLDASKKENQPADAYYATNLLKQTGILVVPGSGFGQVPGTFHFRTTFLPPSNQIDSVIERLGSFHQRFLDDHQ